MPAIEKEIAYLLKTSIDGISTEKKQVLRGNFFQTKMALGEL